MNKIGIHFGSFVDGWMDNQFPLIKKAKQLGFDLLELGGDYIFSLDSADLRKLRSEAGSLGVELTASMGLAADYDIASPKRETRDRGIKKLKELAPKLVEAGILNCNGILYCSWNTKMQGGIAEKHERWKISVESMRDVACVLKKEGAYFNIEVTNRFENYLINTCEEALAYLQQVDSKHIGIHLDTFHMNIEEDSFVTPIIKSGRNLRYFHIGENNRKMPGLGMLPWKTIFDTLKSIGYTQPIAMEPFVRPSGEIGSAVCLYRNMMDLSDYENDLRQSLAFVRSCLR